MTFASSRWPWSRNTFENVFTRSYVNGLPWLYILHCSVMHCHVLVHTEVHLPIYVLTLRIINHSGMENTDCVSKEQKKIELMIWSRPVFWFDDCSTGNPSWWQFSCTYRAIYVLSTTGSDIKVRAHGHPEDTNRDKFGEFDQMQRESLLPNWD